MIIKIFGHYITVRDQRKFCSIEQKAGTIKLKSQLFIFVYSKILFKMFLTNEQSLHFWRTCETLTSLLRIQWFQIQWVLGQRVFIKFKKNRLFLECFDGKKIIATCKMFLILVILVVFSNFISSFISGISEYIFISRFKKSRPTNHLKTWPAAD